MAKKINNQFDIGQFVWLITDPDQERRMVISILVMANDNLLYRLVCGETESSHYAIEISETKDVM